MKTFAVFLDEARFHQELHINPHPDTVKNIAKKAGSVRFVIHSNGDMHAGSSYSHTHDSLIGDADTYHAAGVVHHVHGNEFCMYAEAPDHNNPIDHPHIKRLEKHGVELSLTSAQTPRG